MWLTDQLRNLVTIRERNEARRLFDQARGEVPTAFDRLANATQPDTRANVLRTLAELHSAMARLHPQPRSAEAARVRADASVYRVLADVDVAVATGLHRRHTTTALEPLAGKVLDRMAASTDPRDRIGLLRDLAAALGPEHAAWPAVDAVTRASLHRDVGDAVADQALPVTAMTRRANATDISPVVTGSALPAGQAFAPLTVTTGPRDDPTASPPPAGLQHRTATPRSR